MMVSDSNFDTKYKSLSLSLNMQKLVSHIPEKNSIEIVNDPINEYDPEYHDDP